jgi:DedD protein
MEQDLKQRLIGVTIIVALVVIFVPMLFDESPDKTAGGGGIPPIPSNVMETTLELPKSAEDVAPAEEKPEPESGFRIVPLTDPPVQKPEPEPAKAQVQPGAAEELEEGGEEDFAPAHDKPAVAADKPVAEPPKKPVVAVAPAAEKPVKPAPEKPAAAEIKKPKPATEPARKPEPAGERPPVSAKPEPVTEPAKKLKPAAEAVKKLKPFESVESVAAKPEPQPVTKPAPVKPAPAAAAPKPAEPKVAEPVAAKPAVSAKPAPVAPPAAVKPEETAPGADVWVIQAGSFSSEEKARALADKLRQSKFPAFIESATSDHGPTYRVQIGPELDRGRAEQIQKQVESGVGIRGIIVPHP